MLESSKKIGRYENPLLQRLEKFLTTQGYDVLTHIRLNVAWSNIISDIDVLAVSQNERIIIEVKSNHDNFYKAFKQLNQLKGFADSFYIATDKPVDTINMAKWVDDSIGLICLNEKGIDVIKAAKCTDALLKPGEVSQLKKTCLVNLARLFGIPTYLSKDEIEKRLIEKSNSAALKKLIQDIVLCENECANKCTLIPCTAAKIFST